MVRGGLAQYLETLRFAEDGSGHPRGGQPPGPVVLQPLPRQRLRGVPLGGKFNAQDATKTLGLYGTSWLLVHWLSNTHPEEFARYQTLLAKGIDPDKAWKAVFPSLTFSDLDTELHEYADHGDYHYFVVTIPTWSRRRRSERLTSADVHAVRASADWPAASIWWMARKQLADVRAELAAALADDPATSVRSKCSSAW